MTSIVLLLTVLALPADVPSECKTPKVTVATFLDALAGPRPNVARAATCVSLDDGFTASDAERALTRMKRVLDARGIYIRLEEIPDDADYRDPLTGFQRVHITGQLSGLEVVRTDTGWRFPTSTLTRADQLFRETFPIDVMRVVDHFPPWTKVPVLGVAVWQVVLLGALFLFGWLVRLFFASVVTRQLRKLMSRLGIVWGDVIMHKAALPIGNLALAGVTAVGLPSLQLGVQAAVLVFLAVRILAAVSVVLLLYRVVDLFGYWLEQKSQKTETKLDDQLVPIVRRSLKVVTAVIGVIFVLQNLDVDVTSLLTGLGLGGLAFALAAKDVVSNFFGSVTIFLDKPFQIGDWVQVAGVEGVVEEVGIRSTRIRTFYNSVVTVPNGKFTDAIVDNYGMRQHRRTSVKLSVTYDTTPHQIEAFCDGIRAIVAAHPKTRKDVCEIHFAGYGDSGLDVMLYFFFTVTSWTDELRARHEVYLDVKRLADDLGVRFAFPTRTLHIESQATTTDITIPPAPTDDEMRRAVQDYGPDGARVIAPGPRLRA